MTERPIRIGNQTAFSASTPWEPFLYAAKRGFDAFEWFPDKKEWGEGWEVGDLNPECREKIKETAQRHDIRLSVHAPWWVNTSRPEDKEPLEANIRFAGDIGAALLNIHLHLTGELDHFVFSLAPIIEDLEKAGIDLSIENTPLTSPEEFNRLFARIEDWRTPGMRVGMCLDLGHANLYASTRNDYLAYVDRLEISVPIIHLHAHENYGDGDSHLPLFTGPAAQNPQAIASLVQRLEKRRFSGSVILEQWPQPPSLLDDARDRLGQIFSSVPPLSR